MTAAIVDYAEPRRDIMSRLIGMVLFVLIVMATVGGYHVKAQEAATLKDRVATLESQVVDLQAQALPPPSPYFNDGTGAANELVESTAHVYVSVFAGPLPKSP